jgi:uncharacterized membrane protein
MDKRLLKTVIIFCVGFCGYLLLEIIFRGHTYAMSGILGGISIVLIDKLNDWISWDVDILLQGVIGSCIITYFELIVGELAKQSGLLPIMWDYSNVVLNYDGVICAPFSVIWIFLSIAAVFIADAINYYLLGDEDEPYYKLFGKVIFRYHK